MASEWNLWVWLECIGVVSGWCCKEVYRYPHIIITYHYWQCILFFDKLVYMQNHKRKAQCLPYGYCHRNHSYQ